MTFDEVLERFVLAFERTFDHVMYGTLENVLFPDLGIIAAAFVVNMFFMIIFVFIFFGIFGGRLVGR